MPGLKVNGKLTLGENIADLGGINVAHDALQRATKDQPDPKIDGLTREQRFFLGFASAWRAQLRPEAMLPRATHTRGAREAAKGKQSGRTQEIQRLIGRSLRAVVDLPKLGERQVIVDCDVIQADGGTRTASISGAWVALRIAIDKLLAAGTLTDDPIRTQVAAVSCGIYEGTPVLDLDYIEDSSAHSDGNFVLTGDTAIVEAQLRAEGATFDEEALLRLLRLARVGCDEIFKAQLKAVGK